jgi:hypothetical protein
MSHTEFILWCAASFTAGGAVTLWAVVGYMVFKRDTLIRELTKP